MSAMFGLPGGTLQRLRDELVELRGLIRIVPPLIEQDRQLRWEEIGSRPGDPDSEWIDIYEAEAGPEEGWGHADYARVLYASTVVTAWEAFRFHVTSLLFDATLRYDFSKHPPLQLVVEDEKRSWDRRFDIVVRRYKEFLGIQLTSLAKWESVRHTQLLRNAVVHNAGLFTTEYIKFAHSWRPDPDDPIRFGRVPGDEELVDSEAIPLGRSSVDELIVDLLAVASELAQRLELT
jgi:hypothetical protein